MEIEVAMIWHLLDLTMMMMRMPLACCQIVNHPTRMIMMNCCHCCDGQEESDSITNIWRRSFLCTNEEDIDEILAKIEKMGLNFNIEDDVLGWFLGILSPLKKTALWNWPRWDWLLASSLHWGWMEHQWIEAQLNIVLCLEKIQMEWSAKRCWTNLAC
jgi:hypothetical protein